MVSNLNENNHKKDGVEEVRNKDTTTNSTDYSFTTTTTSKLKAFYDRNGRYLQYGVIGLGIVGLATISRSIHLGSKFTRANKIPQEFYHKNVSLYGQIRSIDIEHCVLQVEHVPIFSWRKWIRKQSRDKNDEEFLRLQIPGLEFCQSYNFMVNVNSKISQGRIKFTLLQFNDTNKAALCLIYYRRFLLTQNFSVWCVKNNIAKMSSMRLLNDLPKPRWNTKQLPIYYKPLLKLEESQDNKKRENIYIKVWNKLKHIITGRVSFRASKSKSK